MLGVAELLFQTLLVVLKLPDPRIRSLSERPLTSPLRIVSTVLRIDDPLMLYERVALGSPRALNSASVPSVFG